VLAGYNQTATAVGTNASASNVVERVAARINMSGSIDTSTAFIDAVSQQSVRSAWNDTGDSIYITGNGGNNVTIGSSIPTSGVHLGHVGTTTGGSSLSIQLNPTGLTGNNRVVTGYNGQLYVNSGATSNPNALGRGVNYVRDATTDNTPIVPTTNTNQAFSLGGFPTGNNGSPTPSAPQPDDYWFADNDTIYLADNRTDASNMGGIQKWIRNAGSGTATLSDDTWSFAYVMPLGATGIITPNGSNGGVVAAHGVSGTVINGVTTVYATSFEAGGNQNRVWAITDGGSTALSTSTLLALSGTNTAFRGVEIVPLPEPAALSLLGVAGVAALRRRRRA